MVRKKNKTELKQMLEKIIMQIEPNFNLYEVILFGSYATGKEKDESDVDVVLISPDLSSNLYSNIKKIKQKTNLLEPGLQLIPFSPQDYYDEDYAFPSFIKDIKDSGKRIYTKEKGLDLSRI